MKSIERVVYIMKKMTDFFFINAYEKDGKRFVVFTDKRDKKAYTINNELLIYVLEHSKPVKKGEN